MPQSPHTRNFQNFYSFHTPNHRVQWTMKKSKSSTRGTYSEKFHSPVQAFRELIKKKVPNTGPLAQGCEDSRVQKLYKKDSLPFALRTDVNWWSLKVFSWSLNCTFQKKFYYKRWKSFHFHWIATFKSIIKVTSGLLILKADVIQVRKHM